MTGAAVQGAEASVRSRLEVAATPIVSTSILPRVVIEFARSHPHVRVHLMDGDVGIVRHAVLNGEADVGLGFFVKPATGLVREPLCKFRLMRISPPGTERPGLGPSRPWSSLAGLPLVSLPAGNPVQAVIERHLTTAGRSHEERSVMNFLGTIIAMVEAGLGHAVVPSFVLQECLRHGLGVAMLVDPAVRLDLFVVSRRGAPPKQLAT
jgi:LysR family carnitine catabolism transcriptional activator